MNATPPSAWQLPHLETFAKAAETGSFTGAAKAFGVTQAAVSQRIHALEKVVGKPLFLRRGGRVLLSAAGQTLYTYAQRILNLHRDARREITGQDIPVVAELTLAASSVPGEHLLPSLLAAFRQKYPHIQLRATVGDSMTVVVQVERGEVSLGLVGRKTDHDYLEFRFLRDRMVAVFPCGHPLAKRKRVAVAELVRHVFVLRESGSGSRHCLEQSLGRAGVALADLQIGLELGSNEAVKEAVLRGVGVAVLSAYTVQKERTAGQLRVLEIDGLHCNRDMFIVQDRRRVLPIPARQFLTFVETNPVADLTS